MTNRPRSTAMAHRSRSDSVSTAVYALILTAVWLTVCFASGDAAGWMLLSMAVVLPFLCKDARRDVRCFRVFLIAVVLHCAIAVWNAYAGPSFGADADAWDFHQYAASAASMVLVGPGWVPGADFYRMFLTAVYRTFGASLLLGSATSVFAFAVSCGFLLRVSHHVVKPIARPYVLAAYSFLPTMVLLGSVTLRESWQAMLLLSAVCAILEFRARPSFAWIAAFAASVLGLMMTHPGLALYGGFLATTGLWFAFARGDRVLARKIVALPVAALVLLGWLYVGRSLGTATTALVEGNAVKYLQEHDDVGVQARATYRTPSTWSGAVSGLVMVPVAFVQYMICPLPWQVRSAVDVYACTESLFRVLLIFLAIRKYFHAQGKERAIIGYILVVFLALELVWSLGTSNWGTAMRHHLPAYGLLLAIGWPEHVNRRRRLNQPHTAVRGSCR